MTNEVLKKCPFCGGSASIVVTGRMHYVQCNECGSRGKQIRRHTCRGQYLDASIVECNTQASKQWNRRIV